MRPANHDVVSTPAAGPIRQEDGSRYYEEAWGGNNSTTVKFFESWSSIRSLYKHIYTSPAVERVFRSAAFSPMLASRPVLEGPFKVRCECLLPSFRPQPPLGQAPRATALPLFIILRSVAVQQHVHTILW